MSIQNCNHGNSAPADVLENLHDSQAGSGRHKCAVCAYNEGYNKGRRSGRFNCPIPSAYKTTLRNLPSSQAGAGRHKCCVCAYHRGFEAGRAYAATHP